MKYFTLNTVYNAYKEKLTNKSPNKQMSYQVFLNQNLADKINQFVPNGE